jgi:hypothetical protein
MKVASADSSCSVVWWGARAACAEVSTGSVEASQARPGSRTPESGATIWLPVYTENNNIIRKYIILLSYY